MIPKTVSNVIKIVSFFAAPSIPIILIAWFAGGTEIAAVALIILITLSSIIYKLSGRIIIRWYNAQRIDPSESQDLHSIIEDLSSKAKVFKPVPHIFESPIPTIFTVGTGKKNDVVVSTKSLDMFDEAELEALFAHEIGHIKNKDVSLNTIVALFAGTIAAFSTAAMWGSMLIGFGQQFDTAPRLIRFLVMGLAAPPAALSVQLAIPQEREYKADEIAAQLTEKPQILTETLERIERYIQFQPPECFNPGHVHMFQIHPLEVEELYDIHLSLFNTHPELHERRDRLMRLYGIGRV